jgi:hypothetical protein
VRRRHALPVPELRPRDRGVLLARLGYINMPVLVSSEAQEKAPVGAFSPIKGVTG